MHGILDQVELLSASNFLLHKLDLLLVKTTLAQLGLIFVLGDVLAVFRLSQGQAHLGCQQGQLVGCIHTPLRYN